MIEFWLNLGFRRILSSNAGKGVQKVHFYKPCTLTVFESEFNRVNRTLHLKVGATPYKLLVYTVSRLAIDRFVILWSLQGSFRCCETECEAACTTFLSLDTQNIERGQLRCAPNCT